MSALWVLPSIDPVWRAECLAGLRAQHVLVVNNAPPHANVGVSRPWNLGARAAAALGVDYLVLLSESVRFGPSGGLDLEEALDGSSPLVLTTCVGFHLLAFSLPLLDAVGEFDENLPTYGSDRDLLVRLAVAGLPAPGYNDQPVPQLQVDVIEAGVAHSLTSGLVEVSFAQMEEYLAAKWGGTGPGEHYRHPFDDPAHDWRWWPTPGLSPALSTDSG